jgi:hypothetical protein
MAMRLMYAARAAATGPAVAADAYGSLGIPF